MNDNQNAFVTRSTSRVLAEPGGKSSMGFLFGGGGGSTTPKKQQTSNNTTCTEEQKNNSVATTTKAVESTTNNDKKKEEEEVVAPTTTAVQEEESAITAAARIKAQNESQHFSLFGVSSNVKVIDETKTVSANAYASSATTNSYNVLTDRPTSRVVSFVECYFI